MCLVVDTQSLLAAHEYVHVSTNPQYADVLVVCIKAYNVKQVLALSTFNSIHYAIMCSRTTLGKAYTNNSLTTIGSR